MTLTIEGTKDEIVALVRELGEAPELLLTNANKIVLPEGLTADKIMAFKDENEGGGK